MQDDNTANHWIRREWPVVVALLLPAAAIWAFVELADGVRDGKTEALDSRILLALRNPADPTDPIGPPWLEETMRDFTALGSTGVLSLVALGAIGYLLLVRKRHAALALTVAVASGMIASTLLKYGFDRQRPDLTLHATRVYTSSFPSGHSMMSAVVYLTLAVMIARVQAQGWLKIYVLAIAVLIVVLVGCSRIYLGVHWPTDVLAGWTIGAAWALGWWAILILLQRRGSVERTGEP